MFFERSTGTCVLTCMDPHDDYRAKAEEAQKQANLAHNEVARAAWLRVAQGWLSLLRKRPQCEDDPNSSK